MMEPLPSTDLYEELRRLAQQLLGREKPGQTLQATALVHEAYLKLAKADGGFADRRHFFNSAAEAMRRILIDQARRKKAHKHGGQLQQVQWPESQIAEPQPNADYERVGAALDQLQTHDPDSAELVKLRYFVGLTMSEIAETMQQPLRTVERNWTYAKAWLLERIQSAE